MEKNNRLKNFIACLIICLISGYGYAWSVFQLPIVEQYGLEEMGVALCFTLTILFSTFTPLIFGKLIKKMSMQKICIVGGILLGLGIFFSGIVRSTEMLYLTYGVTAGIGVGFIYPSLMSYSVKLFPNKKGLSSGLMAASYGSGAVLWSLVISKLLSMYHVSSVFKILGIGFFIIILISSFFVGDIRDDSVKNSVIDNHAKQYTRKEMMKTSLFYIMVITFTLGLTSGLMVIGQASPILQNTLNFSKELAATFVGVFSLCNTFGRLIFGSMSDKIGIMKTVRIIFLTALISMGLMYAVDVNIIVIVCMGLAAMSYGGFASIITPITGDIFGQKHITENYGAMYVVFGLAGLIGPRLAIYFKTINNGSYSNAFLFTSLLSFVGIVLTFIIELILRKNSKEINA